MAMGLIGTERWKQKIAVSGDNPILCKEEIVTPKKPYIRILDYI